MRSRFLAAIVAFALCLPTAGMAQYYGNGDSTSNLPIHTIGPSQGGAIGMSFDTNLYTCGSRTCLKVIGLNGTNFSAVRIGDYVYQVNNVYFHSVDDFFGLIRENPPGTIVRIDYWDSANGRAMYQSAALRAGQSSSNNSLASLQPQLEQVMRADARHWRASTYHRDSLRGLYVASSSGQSYTIRGTYDYDGFMTSNNTDWIDFHFYGRDLTCIEFGEERGCRPLLTADRSMLGPVLAVAGAAAVAWALSSRNSSGSTNSGGDYGGQSRSQCLSSCSQMGVDPNPNVAAAIVAQCQRRC